MRPLTRPRRRGQTLILFAVSMLVLVMMVAMTLSTGMKVREKMEVQAVSDAAAYSNAVVVARAYNEIAILNRAQIGTMVSMATTQSLISWMSYYRAQVEAARRSYMIIAGFYGALAALCCQPFVPVCPQMCACAVKALADSIKSITKISKYQKKRKKDWDNPDKSAALLPNMQMAVAGVHFIAQTDRWMEMNKKLNDQSLAKGIVNKAKLGSRWPSEWSAPNGGDGVSLREAGPLGGIMPVAVRNEHHLYAAMGSRGYMFTTNRSLGFLPIMLKLMADKVVENPDVVFVTDQGSGYFADSKNHGAFVPSGRFSWADDHGRNVVLFLRNQAPCPPFVGTWSADAHVKTTDLQDKTDEHKWSPSEGKDKDPAHKRHTLQIPCIGPTSGPLKMCPNIWPMFVDYNPLKLFDPLDNYGQPKTYATIQRNYAVRGTLADPWNFAFNFKFASSGGGVQFDNSGLRLPSQGNLNVSRQTALSSGLTYYHRYGHWKEPPNLLNPYWRATLGPLTVDSGGRGNDIPNTLNDVGVGWAADAARQLKSVGYQGGP